MAKQKVQKKSNALVWIVLTIIVAAALWYYLKSPVSASSIENITSDEHVTTLGIAKGDLVAMDFVLKMQNGTVIGTNNATLAEDYRVKNYVKHGPYRFIVGQSDMVKGFDDALLGMDVNDTATKIIPPSEPVLELRVNTTRRVVRNQPYPRFHELSISKFKRAFFKDPVADMVVMNASLPWPLIVVNMTNDTVLLEANVVEGKTYHLPGYEWNSSVVIKAGNTVLVRHNPIEGQTMHTDFGPATVHVGDAILNITYQVKQNDVLEYAVPVQGQAGAMYEFKVLSANDRQFIIRRIDYPAQETLELTAHILDRTPHVKDVKAPINTK
jgi:hypothetical protein